MTDKDKILAVDDTPASLRLLTDILKAEGYDVRPAISGELALYSATINPPDLVLLDISMPVMDGFEVCRRLKAQPETRNVPVIFVSGMTEISEKVQGFELGAVDFVTKPYQRDELLARVRTHLELNRLRHHLEELVEERTAELMESEKRVHKLNDSLEQRVREEVAKNHEKDALLIQQSRLAAMGEMIHNIAHQWRQPINALTLLLANIKDAYEYRDLTQEYLDREINAGQRLIQDMSNTIDDFRNFFKSNKEKEMFHACDSILSAIKLVNDSFAAHNIKIIQEKVIDPCTISGHPNEYAQVVLNVLTNAKEAIVDKNIAGEIHVQMTKDDKTIMVSIRDNGGGIPEDVLPKIFDPYFTTKGAQGSGIGLYMSKMIMKNMDGDITIRNAEGGAEVLLTLPLAKPAE